jgi:glycosyltransferase involved in cell wall biosynthesis
VTRVSVCVVVKDRRELMLRCLDAVLAQVPAPDEVVVVDNGSSDGTYEALLDRAAAEPRLRVVQDRGSLGAIRNRAAREATGDVVAFTDSDCRPRPGWLAAGLAALAAGVPVDGPAAGDPPWVAGGPLAVVQGRTVPEHEPTVPFSATQDLPGFTGLFEACNVFYRRAPLLAGGGFDAAVGFFGEDTAAGWGVLRAGGHAGFAPEAVVEHVVTTPGFGWHLRRTAGYANWPALLAAFPEQRRLLWHQVFLRRRSAETDLLLAGLVVGAATATRQPLLGAAVAGAAALPFGRRHRPRGRSRRALTEAAAGAAFDVAISVALLRGSVRHRTPVL